jgi:hypothetical protein
VCDDRNQLTGLCGYYIYIYIYILCSFIHIQVSRGSSVGIGKSSIGQLV